MLADHYQQKTYLVKTMVIMGGSFFAPFLIYIVTSTDNFYAASAFWILKVFIHACFWGPTVTMIQDTTPQHLQPNAVSLFYVVITLAQVISPIPLSLLASAFHAD